MQTKTLVSANIFCTRLKSLQKRLNLQSNKLAERIGVSEPTVSQWRGGRHLPHRDLWDHLADILETTVDELFFTHVKTLHDPKFSECRSAYRRSEMIRPIMGPPDDELPKITRESLEEELAYYLDCAENAGALSVAALQIRKHLNPEDFDYLSSKPTSK